jgi:hypothetical protein
MMDICDKCGAQALFKAEKIDGAALMFCGHHYHDYHEALTQQGFITTAIQEELEPA